MTTHGEILDFYRQPGVMTSPGRHAPLFETLPGDVQSIARAVQGLFIHEHIAGAYGVQLTDERRNEVHVRSNPARLDCLLARDGRSLSVSRPPAERMVADCRHYTVFAVGALRAHGVPARARCGFGSYFEPGKFIDHWVCEYWNAAQARWVLVDTQIDEVQQPLFKPDFDVLDVPRDRFFVAGDAWRLCRRGSADPAAFGVLDMNGPGFIAGNVVRDLAALNNMEMLPWDVWGAMPQPGEAIEGGRLALFDRLAIISSDPDAHFAELRERYAGDDLRVPGTVFNAVRGQPEAV